MARFLVIVDVNMPIYEYSCQDCNTRFEKLLRNTAEREQLACPSCGHNHLRDEYSTFAAHASGPAPADCSAPAGACGGGACQLGMCGMNFN